MLNVDFSGVDVARVALGYEGWQQAAGNTKLNICGHRISEVPSVKGLHIEALTRRLARGRICSGSQILKSPSNA
ncbi:hypothetical protein XarjCFBP7653_04590 [Xanthomonas arboricola]|nr:hypothetical protein XarjCFBP7653_04590 [Xanthomonas arboricola]